MKKFSFLLLSVLPCLAICSQNIGIGTTAPLAPLHIRTTSSHVMRIEGTNPFISFFDGTNYTGYLWYNSNRLELGTPFGSTEAVAIAPGNTANAFFTSNGRLGLGTSIPSERLHVAGNMNLTGLLKINGVSGTAGQVLMSNGAADPQWQNAAYSNNTRFSFNLQEAAVGTGTVDITTTNYNLNTADIVRNASSISINKTGLYHFDIYAVAFWDYDETVAVPPTLFLSLAVNGDVYNLWLAEPMKLVPYGAGDDFSLSKPCSIDIHVTAPTTLSLSYQSYHTGTPGSRNIYGQLLGYLITE